MIEEYVKKLRAELLAAGADPAVIQDAVYDAEEYLRSEASAAGGQSAEDAEGVQDTEGTEKVLKGLIDGYGTPAEVAASYLEAELTVAQALRLPEPVKHHSLLGRIFGVFIDPRTYGALFYMFLSLATGIAYSTLAVTGLSLSLGMAILIFGIPVMLLFLSLIRGVSFVEGRVVEALLGVRMPRRPRVIGSEGSVIARDSSVIARIKWWLTDGRTWTTLLYMLIQLPLGIIYFTVLVTALSLSFAMVMIPVMQFGLGLPIAVTSTSNYFLELWTMPFVVILGGLLVLALMHLVRGIGKLHGAYAKAMLVGDFEEGAK